MIAGHTFFEGLNGRVCCCGTKWKDIMGATEEHVGKVSWDCTGLLTTVGLAQIQREKNRVWELVVAAAVAGASPPAPDIEDDGDSAAEPDCCGDWGSDGIF